MDFRELDILIDKYCKGETSLEEEGQIRNMLAHPELPEAYYTWKSLFTFYEQAGKIRLPDSSIPLFSERKQSLGWWESAWVKWTSIAATILMLVGIGYFLVRGKMEKQEENTAQQYVEDTFENPDLAYQQAKEALLLLSEKLNTGLQYGSELKKLENIESHIQEHE